MALEHRLGPAAGDDGAITALARRAEGLGSAAVWSSEAGHDPFLALRTVIDETSRTTVGTAVAVAYARSPMATAMAAWDLQRLSGGRFVLGLGTQVRAHVERRYGMPWPGGVGPLREYVQVLRAIWRCWQLGERPGFTGDHYRFTLSNPEFEPPALPSGQAEVPVWLAAVGPAMAALCGEVADGVHGHAFHTPGYLREVLVPAARSGAARAGRDPGSLTWSAPVFAGVAHDDTERAGLRAHFARHLGFFASTPAYRPVLAHGGWEAVHDRLRELARAGRWDELGAAVPGSMLDEFTVIAEPAELGEVLVGRYGGLLDQVGLYRGSDAYMSEDDWGRLAAAMQGR